MGPTVDMVDRFLAD
uniref:Uncharacterized protein n=1 Tax=Anguilla anguilla TaxID=7936 RepID=A0A0E9UZX4_ANGAN